MSTPFWMTKSGWNSTAKGHITAIEDSHRQTDSIYNRHIWESDGIQNMNAQNSTSGKLIVQIRSRKACSQSHAEGNLCTWKETAVPWIYWGECNLKQWLKLRALDVSYSGEGVGQWEFPLNLLGVRNGGGVVMA